MSTVPCEIDSRAAELLREVQAWRLLGLLFERPRGTWWQDVARLAAETDDPDLRAAAELASSAQEGDFLALLGPNGPVSPREAGYRRTADPARTLAEIRAFHAAFAFQPECEDPLDHVAVQCGFLGWLRLKEAYASANADLEAAEVTHAAAERFLREHLATCAEPLVARLEAFDSGHLLPAARALLARTGPRPKDVEGDWVPQGLGIEDCTLTCGLAGLAGGGEGEEGELPPEFTAGLPRES